MTEQSTRIGAELNDQAVQITGLAESLCFVSGETIVTNDFSRAMQLAWAYEALAETAQVLASRLKEVAP
jgi:hypothetical protein